MFEYKVVKKITGKEIYKYNPCEDEFEKFVNIYGFSKEAKFDEEFFKSKNGWIEFLVKNGFIEKKYDQKYIYAFYSENSKTIYKLHKISGSRYAWIDLSTSNCWANSTFETMGKAIKSYETEFIYKCFKTISEFIEWCSEAILKTKKYYTVCDYSYSIRCDGKEGSMFSNEGSTYNHNPTKYTIINEEIKVESHSTLGKIEILDTRIKSEKTGIEYYVQKRFLVECK